MATAQERYVAMRPGSRHVVDQLDTLVLQIAQVLTDVERAEAQVMQPRSTPLEEAGDGRIGISRFEQLDQQVRGLDKGNFELTFG